MRKKITLFLFFSFFVCFKLVSQSNAHGELIGTQLSYYIDTTSQYSIENVLVNPELFTPSKNNSLHFGTTEAAIWLKYEAINTENFDLIAEFGYPYLDTIDFYMFDLEGNLMQSERYGSVFPFKNRQIIGNNFKFQIPPGDWIIVWRVKSLYNIQVPFRVHTWETLKAAKSSENLLNGIYIGFCIVIIAYNFFLYLFIKDHIFNYYILHVIATAVITLHLTGITYQYLWPNAPLINLNEPLIYGLGIFSTLFSIKFLQLKNISVFWDKVLWGVFWVNIPVFILILINQKLLANIWVQLVGSIGCSLMIVAGCVAYFKGYTPARFYVLAFTIFLVGVVISILSRMNVLPNTPIFIHASQFGSGMDIILLSVAVADRFNKINKEKLESEKLLLAKTIENKKLVESRNNELETLVQERTSKLSLVNQELEKKSVELSDINAYKDKIFTVIAHDLKGNISSIKGLLDLVDKTSTTMDVDSLQTLQNTADNTYSLLNNLLTWGTLNRGDFRPKNELISLKDSITQCLDWYRPQMYKKSLTCDVQFEGKDFQVFADSNYINIVLRNLISNAIKFTSVGGTISVELTELKTQEYFVIKVKDSGIGMSEERMNSLFETAPQKSTKGTDGEHGTGLGMVLVKEILDAMNIEIQVESILKKGTSFTMKIPKSI